MLALVLLDLTFREVLTDIPHDAGAVIAYIMIALFVVFTFLGSRRRSAAGETSSLES
jgi:hypothetical protein